MKFRLPEIFLGCFLTIAVFVMGFVFSSPYHPQPQNAEQSQTHSGSDHKSDKETTEERLADYTWWLALLTGVLAVSTVGLWIATGIGVRVQINDTRILQRAYISVSPRGVRLFVTRDAYSCDVSFDNVGHLPARNVKWFIDRMFSDERWLKDFPIKEDEFEGNIVIAPGLRVKKGAQRIDTDSLNAAIRRPGTSWLYVWGRVIYDDGFGKERFTSFCFRYNTSAYEGAAPRSGIAEEDGRYHVYGNDAD